MILFNVIMPINRGMVTTYLSINTMVRDVTKYVILVDSWLCFIDYAIKFSLTNCCLSSISYNTHSNGFSYVYSPNVFDSIYCRCVGIFLHQPIYYVFCLFTNSLIISNFHKIKKITCMRP